MAITASRPRPDRIGPAIALRLLAALLATGIGVCAHGAADAGATVGQVVTLRAGLSVPLLVLWALATGPLAAMRPRAPRKHIVRGLLGGATMVLNFYALSVLPVSHAQSLGYLAPVLALPLAVLLLGERLTGRGVVAVSLGCAGMLAMLGATAARPGWGAAELSGVVAGIVGAAVMALVRVHIRAMTATESVISIALSFAVIATAIGLLVSLVTGWAPMTPVIWAWVGGAGLFGAATHVLATEASARAPVSTLAPFDYAGLAFAVALDAMLFAHLPGPWGWVGIALIAAGGAATLGRPRPEGSFLRLK